MVELNSQPQDVVETPGMPDESAELIQIIEQMHHKSASVVNSYISSLEDFREQVSHKLLVVIKEVDELRAMFETF
jgi:vesicle coat complex subunit